MGAMSVCTLQKICNTSSMDRGDYCGWFSLYKESCMEMMAPEMVSSPMMGECNNFTSMCMHETVVGECKTAIIGLPGYPELLKNVTSMCKTMPGMTACSDCDQCTELQMYSELCKEMGGDMEECYEWNKFCKKIPDWSLCSNTPGDIIPLMQMYFHWGIYDYILFKTWVPYNGLTYGISLIAVFFMALLHEGFKVAKVNLEIRWKLDARFDPVARTASTINMKSHMTIVYSPFDWRRDLLRALYRCIDVASHFFIMLITMTFNAGLFIAVVLGYGAGHLLFSRLSKPQLAGSLFDDNEEACH